MSDERAKDAADRGSTRRKRHMAVDMKQMIAEATRTLLIDKHVKKLTVKDIVEQCHITRL